MKGLIIVSDRATSSSVFGPEGLRPLLGRPFVAHVLEQLALKGLREVEVVLDTPSPLDYERRLGNGDRYGMSIRYHLVRDPGQIGARLRRIAGDVLIAVAHRVVDVSRLEDAGRRPTVWRTGDANGAFSWSGWGALPDGALASIPNRTTLAGFGAWLLDLAAAEGTPKTVSQVLKGDDMEDLLRAQRDAFDAEFLQVRGRLVSPGIRIGRGVQIDPSAKLEAPIFLGDHVRIAAGARVGPCAYVSSGAIIGRESVVRNAIVERRTSIGDQLEVRDAAVTPRGIVLASPGVEVRIEDAFIVSAMDRPTADWRTWGHRAMGAGLFAAGLPFALPAFLWLRAKGYSLHREASQAKSGASVWRWRHPKASPDAPDQPSFADFFARVWPALIEVARGRVGLIGRDASIPAFEGNDHPPGWRERLRALEPGLISEALVENDPSPLVRRLADLTFAAAPSAVADVRLIRRYLARLFSRKAAARALEAPRVWAAPAEATMRN